MKRHTNEFKVVSPAIQFISRAAKHYAPAVAYMLKNKAINIIVDALKATYADEMFQLEALRLLQMLSRTTEGWNQISSIKGGWQAICQGTAAGDALVHDLPGALNNPGWCIGDTHHLPVIDRARLEATKAAASITREAPKTAWTSMSLKQYLGLSMKSQTLSINNDFHDMQFTLLSKLDLLPRPGEDKEYYFIRLKEYEQESDISIEEMTTTMLDMKKAAELKAASEHKSEESGANIKPVYFMGSLYSAQALDEADINIVEDLKESILLEQQEEEKAAVLTAADDEGDDDDVY